MVMRWDKLLDGSVTAPVDGDRSIVVKMREESAYWLAQARDSFEQGEFEIMDRQYLETLQIEAQMMYEQTSGPDAQVSAQTVILAEIALQLATHNHWLEQIAHRLKNIDDNSIVMREKP